MVIFDSYVKTQFPKLTIDTDLKNQAPTVFFNNSQRKITIFIYQFVPSILSILLIFIKENIIQIK